MYPCWVKRRKWGGFVFLHATLSHQSSHYSEKDADKRGKRCQPTIGKLGLNGPKKYEPSRQEKKLTSCRIPDLLETGIFEKVNCFLSGIRMEGDQADQVVRGLTACRYW